MNLHKYVGIPYQSRSDKFSGSDCYGLCRLFYREELGIDLPDYFDLYADAEFGLQVSAAILANRSQGNWKEVESPELFDIVVFNVKGLPAHCGIVLENNEFLHCFPGYNSSIETFDSVKWSKRIDGYSTWTHR